MSRATPKKAKSLGLYLHTDRFNLRLDMSFRPSQDVTRKAVKTLFGPQLKLMAKEVHQPVLNNLDKWTGRDQLVSAFDVSAAIKKYPKHAHFKRDLDMMQEKANCIYDILHVRYQGIIHFHISLFW